MDGNQGEIVAALRAAGAHVQSMASIGKGCPDLLVSYQGRWYVAEVKGPDGTLTNMESKWHAKARAWVHILRSVDDALEMIAEALR